MTRVATQPLPPPRKATPAEISQYVGEVVYLYAFDLAYEFIRRPVSQLLGQPVAQFVVDASKRSPKQLFFYRPQMVRLPPLERLGPLGPTRVERSIKIFPIGAVSIVVRVPFVSPKIDDLVAFHDLQFSDGTWLYDEIRALASDVQRELRPYLIRPVELGDEEAYTVFCIRGPLKSPDGGVCAAEDWLLENRRRVAALLTEERDPARLSEQEADESTTRYLTYYERDLVVVDWDAALVIDEPRYFDETLYLMELANVQLAELEAYDRILDDAVERSYRDVSRRHRLRGGQNTAVQRELREIRIDLARLSDELSNITKFFGDWHSARIYQALAARLHLSDWHHSIDQKLKTLDEMYQLLGAEQNNRWMLILEVTVVILFLLEFAIGVVVAVGHH